MTAASFNLPSLAKLNWSLRILAKRPDGYHEIITVFQTISLRDELHFSERADDELVLSCNEPTIPTDKTNLILRAAIALRESCAIKKGAEISLTKRIPSQAGLGGASSNAAITLIGLNRLWKCGLSTAELVEIGANIGADVPFFFIGGTALGAGTGTHLSPLDDVFSTELIIVSPNTSVSTKAAYALLNAGSLTTPKSASILARSFGGSFSGSHDQWPLENDFEKVIFEIEPEIKRVKEALLESGARGALLAGSGSSVFGIFADEEARQRGLDQIELETGWRVFSCKTVSRKDYLGALELPLEQAS